MNDIRLNYQCKVKSDSEFCDSFREKIDKMRVMALFHHELSVSLSVFLKG